MTGRVCVTGFVIRGPLLGRPVLRDITVIKTVFFPGVVDPGEETVVFGVRPDPPENKEKIHYGNLIIQLSGLVK